MNSKRLSSFLCGVCVVFFAVSAEAAKIFTITSNPSESKVLVNNQDIGITPAQTKFDFSDGRINVVSVSKPGYFEQIINLHSKSKEVKTGLIDVVLVPDEGWNATTTSDATNNWVRIQIDSAIPEGEVWQKIVDAVTSRYPSLEQIDNTSGYIRSIYEVKTYKNPQGSYQIRTRLLGSIASKSPLTFKFRIEAEQTSASGQWVPLQRVFKEDAQLMEELHGRLSQK